MSTISVVIPAHNEAQYIERCIRAIQSAATHVAPDDVEIVVVCNRCTDDTAAIARRCGARVLSNDARCISTVRNTGVDAARGEIVATIDADSIMTEHALQEARELLESGRYVGGGANPRFERMSVGIFFSALYVALNLIPVAIRNGAALSGAMFWFYKRDFETIGGFDESLVSLEDMDFATRLYRLGKSRGQRYGTLRRAHVVTSSRKFDEFGDWYLIKNRKLTRRIFTGRDREAADAFYYDVR